MIYRNDRKHRRKGRIIFTRFSEQFDDADDPIINSPDPIDDFEPEHEFEDSISAIEAIEDLIYTPESGRLDLWNSYSHDLKNQILIILRESVSAIFASEDSGSLPECAPPEPDPHGDEDCGWGGEIIINESVILPQIFGKKQSASN